MANTAVNFDWMHSTHGRTINTLNNFVRVFNHRGKQNDGGKIRLKWMQDWSFLRRLVFSVLSSGL